MTALVLLLRGINVGGRSGLGRADLRAIAQGGQGTTRNRRTVTKLVDPAAEATAEC